MGSVSEDSTWGASAVSDRPIPRQRDSKDRVCQTTCYSSGYLVLIHQYHLSSFSRSFFGIIDDLIAARQSIDWTIKKASNTVWSLALRKSRRSQRKRSLTNCAIESLSTDIHFNMESTHNGYQTPRYMEVSPNGQVLRQAPTVPPEIIANYLSPRGSVSYSPKHSTYSYPSNAQKPQWWQTTGAYNPYRTTYQAYGKTKQQTSGYQPTITLYMTRPGQYM